MLSFACASFWSLITFMLQISCVEFVCNVLYVHICDGSECVREWLNECACMQHFDDFFTLQIYYCLCVYMCDRFNKLHFMPHKNTVYGSQFVSLKQQNPNTKKIATNTNKTNRIMNQSPIDFVVHRGRTIPTLASMQEPVAAVRYRQSKERSNLDLKSDDRGKF